LGVVRILQEIRHHFDAGLYRKRKYFVFKAREADIARYRCCTSPDEVAEKQETVKGKSSERLSLSLILIPLLHNFPHLCTLLINRTIFPQDAVAGAAIKKSDDQ
jgi:hypothetical protein